MTPEPASSPLTRAATGLLRAVLALAAMLLMFGALLLGITVAAGIVVWALLRGRRPRPVNLRWGTQRMSPATARTPAHEVVDVTARAVEAPPR